MSTPRIRNLGIASALSAIKPESYEEAVQMLWQVIIGTWFPPQEGYKWAFNTPVLGHNNASNAIVFYVISIHQVPGRPNQFAEHPILMVESKRSSADTPSSWEISWGDQFQEDLEQCGTEQIFGIVAIGRKVKFYRFDPSGPTRLTPLHATALDMDNDQEILSMQQMLDYAKANARQWSYSK